MDKNAIKKFAVWARTELIARVSLKGVEYGITEDNIEDANADSVGGKVLTADEKKQRQDVYKRQDMDITDAIPDMEEADGSAYLLEQLNSAIGNGEFIDKIQYEPHEPGDVLMLTGVGEVFPFMRIHTLLEALQPYFSDVPILVMYPGEFDGRHVKLFNRLTPNDYYRAFNVID